MSYVECHDVDGERVAIPFHQVKEISDQNFRDRPTATIRTIDGESLAATKTYESVLGLINGDPEFTSPSELRKRFHNSRLRVRPVLNSVCICSHKNSKENVTCQ